MKNLFVLFIVLLASSASYARMVCEKNELGIRECHSDLASNSEICQAMSIWESDLLHPDNESYMFEIHCQGFCKPKDRKTAMRAALMQCEYGISGFQGEDITCVKVECGLRVLD